MTLHLLQTVRTTYHLYTALLALTGQQYPHVMNTISKHQKAKKEILDTAVFR